MTMAHRLTGVLLSLLVSACATPVAAPDGDAPPEDEAIASWTQVLHEHVDDRGRIDFTGLEAQPRPLERWVAYVAAVSPATHPGRFASTADEIAYYIDAYNALAMYGVLRSGVLPEQRARFFLLRNYVLGGERTSLYALENDVIRAYGEPRVHFALNCMSVSCPRLPRAPWHGDALESELETAAIAFFGDERNLRVDHAARRVYLSKILRFYSEDFETESGNLIDYVNRYRSPMIPPDYALDFIPYDWTLNAQTQ